MRKLLSCFFILIFLLMSNTSFAGDDGKLNINGNKNNGFKEVKDCFEKINRGVFAFNQGLDKVIFKPFSGLTKEQKLSIVGKLIGVTNKIHSDDIYTVMIDIHDNKQKITIRRLSELLNVSSRTVHRHMCDELKREKELLNQQL